MVLAGGKLEVMDLHTDAFLKEWRTRLQVAKRHLQSYKDKYIRRNNAQGQPELFTKGDLMLLSAQNISLPINLMPKFGHRWYGPYKILEEYNGVTFKLELPPEVKIHNAFHFLRAQTFLSGYTFWVPSTTAQAPRTTT
ncbi:hypothetical protein KP509_10G049800 [Ceratopteris richardii]|nr:hypothetical protein KP509_10G049800 [Ceratopteris richardii]